MAWPTGKQPPRSAEHCAAISRAKVGRARPDMLGDNNPMNRVPGLASRIGAQKAGAAHPNFRGDDVGFTGVHFRLRRDLGPAASHACIDCEGAAHDWSFDEPEGFSLDQARYSPRCRSCHIKYDRSA